MKIPKRIQPLIEDGLVDEVLRQLMSGKEAKVYMVRCGREIRCAKVYKEADKRSFKQAVQYQEGRKGCLLYTSPSPRDGLLSRMPSSA